MKKRCLFIAVIVTILDVSAAVFMGNAWILAAVIFVITGAGFWMIYHLVIRPVMAMKKELEETREENAQLESMRKDFVANVTHELKTPLTSISGFIETLQAGAAEDPEIRSRFLDIMAIETSRLKRLIQDILVLSDIESDRETPDERIDIKSAVEDIAELIQPIADERDVKLITNVGHGLMIRGSADRFRQMIVNILENGIKYSNRGGRVWMDGYLKDGKVVIRIKDEGIGISEENLERLFERFYRVDKSRSRKVGGTGLGLSIVKHIAVLFKAKIKVESELGSGTTFYIFFS